MLNFEERELNNTIICRYLSQITYFIYTQRSDWLGSL